MIVIAALTIVSLGKAIADHMERNPESIEQIKMLWGPFHCAVLVPGDALCLDGYCLFMCLLESRFCH